MLRAALSSSALQHEEAAVTDRLSSSLKTVKSYLEPQTASASPLSSGLVTGGQGTAGLVSLSWARETGGEKGALPSRCEEMYLDGLTTGIGKEKAVQIKGALPEAWPATAVPGGLPLCCPGGLQAEGSCGHVFSFYSFASWV